MFDRSNLARRLSLPAILVLSAGMTFLGAGTAAAASDSIVINSGHGTGLGVNLNVTYVCNETSGFSGFVTGTGVAAGGNGGTTPVCDGGQHNATIGFSCILPGNNCSFLAGDIERATASVGTASTTANIVLS